MNRVNKKIGNADDEEEEEEDGKPANKTEKCEINATLLMEMM